MHPRISAEARVHRLTLGSDSHAVRFLLAVAAVTRGQLLMVLDSDDGEPRRNRTFNPQIKSRIEAVFGITRVPSGTRVISLSDSRLAAI